MESLSQWIDNILHEQQMLRRSFLQWIAFFGAMLSSLVDRYRVPQFRLVARVCFVARACGALRSWVVKEVNKVVSLSNDIDSTVASRFKAEPLSRRHFRACCCDAKARTVIVDVKKYMPRIAILYRWAV